MSLHKEQIKSGNIAIEIKVSHDGKSYKIYYNPNVEQFILENQYTESMGIWPKELFELLDGYFKKNF
jgi:hypothetical protein